MELFSNPKISKAFHKFWIKFVLFFFSEYKPFNFLDHVTYNSTAHALLCLSVCRGFRDDPPCGSVFCIVSPRSKYIRPCGNTRLIKSTYPLVAKLLQQPPRLVPQWGQVVVAAAVQTHQFAGRVSPRTSTSLRARTGQNYGIFCRWSPSRTHHQPGLTLLLCASAIIWEIWSGCCPLLAYYSVYHLGVRRFSGSPPNGRSLLPGNVLQQSETSRLGELVQDLQIRSPFGTTIVGPRKHLLGQFHNFWNYTSRGSRFKRSSHAWIGGI